MRLLEWGMDLSDTEQRLREQMDRARAAKGLTHTALAEKLGVSQPAVAQILSRARGRIPQSLLDVLDALDLDVNFTPRKKR